MGFKEDADFARFVSMGAVGTAAVARHLREKHGHRPIELERYAMANKVWQTKVKRLRLPDLLCVRCGRRIESRAKSKLGIILSHSDIPGREWDAGGMRSGDIYAFIRADLATFPPRVGSPMYFTTGALRRSEQHAKRSARKAASEGSEVMLTWPSWVPKKDGRFVEIDAENRVVCRWNDGKTFRYWQWQRWGEEKHVYLSADAHIDADATIVAGVVAPPLDLACAGDIWDISTDLTASNPADRFAAVKAAGATNRMDLLPMLAEIVRDENEDWRVRVEAYASLAAMQPETWTNLIRQAVLDDDAPSEQRMEAVFILSEISTAEAGPALADVWASVDIPAEVRAAAAWGLGQGAAPRPDLVLPMTLDPDPFVALHAIAAIAELPDELVPTLVGWLADANDRRAAIGAHLLKHHQKVSALLDASEADDRSRLWALLSLGDLEPSIVRRIGGSRVSPELEEMLAPMWRGQTDWLRVEGQDGLESLEVQKVRFDPVNPT